VSSLVTAWQAALAAEYQAVFGYELLGPHAGAEASLATADQGAHERLRDATAAALLAAGAVPVAPAADYPALYPVGDQAAARRLALRLEESCADAWRYLLLVAAPHSSARRTAQENLTASAVRAVHWRRLVDPQHPATAFPGL